MDVNDIDAEVQEVYASWLDLATRASFAATLAAFLIYVSGAVPPYLPLESLPRYWGLPVGEFLRQTGAPSGWGWLTHLGGGAEYLNLACRRCSPRCRSWCCLRRRQGLSRAAKARAC